MKKYIADFNFYLITALTLLYAATTVELNLLYILMACIAILINYYYLVDRINQPCT